MSLKKIAGMVGVSPSTVSRVLNQTSATCASKELKDKIFAAAREIGYQPNENARKLRKPAASPPPPKRVSIVLARIKALEEDPFFYELFRSLEAALMECRIGIGQVIYADEGGCFDLSDSQGVVILGRCSRRLLDKILSFRCSTVGIWRNSMNFDVDEVVCDGKKAAEMAMSHLIGLGHRKIAYIGDCSYESRYVGYCSSLIHHDIPMNYQWIKQTDQTGETGAAAFCELLEAKEEFSAVFCANDVTAIEVLKILKEKRRQIGREISVISIDDIEESQNTSPFLTTIRIPREEMAHMAVLLLLDRMERKHSEAVRIEFPCRIVNRASCYPSRH